MRFVAIDTETTGLKADKHAPIQMALVDLAGTTLTAYIDWTGAPRAPEWTDEAQAVHRLTQQFLQENGSPPATVFAHAGAFLRGAVLVGQNVAFDIAMMLAGATRAGGGTLGGVGSRCIDTRWVDAARYPEAGARHLADIFARWCGDVPWYWRPHDAWSDAMAVRDIWRAQYRWLLDTQLPPQHDDALFWTRINQAHMEYQRAVQRYRESLTAGGEGAL